jgi:colicin import membrane protein
MLSLRGSILLSALFHMVLFLALLFVSSAGRARVVYKPQYQVRLVRPQEVSSLARPAKKTVKKPKPAPPVAKPKPEAKKVVLPKKKEEPPKKKAQEAPAEKKPPKKKVEKKPEPKPDPVEEPKGPSPEEVLEDALARIQKRAGSREKIAAKGQEKASSAWEQKQEEIEFSAYYDQVERAVRENWIPPQHMDFEVETAMTVVSLTLLPDGRVLKSTIEETSGDPKFDQSVMRAILKSTPFPPPPIGGLTQQRFDLGLRFHSTPQNP